MSTFREAMEAKAPHLFIKYEVDKSGVKNFTWGITPGMPPMRTIGQLRITQHGLMCNEYGNAHYIPECDLPALVIALVDGDLRHFVHPSIPRIDLIGMMEIVRELLVANQIQQNASRNVIVGPDGLPIAR